MNRRRLDILKISLLPLLFCGLIALVACGQGRTGDVIGADEDSADDESLPSASVCFDDADCQINFACDISSLRCKTIECQTDAYCRNAYGENALCAENGLCLNILCTSNEECASGEYCSAYACHEMADCTRWAYLTIENAPTTLIAKARHPLKAALFDFFGTRIFSPENVTWESFNPSLATIDESGVITGGATSGTGVISAMLPLNEAGANPVCAQRLSATEQLTNYAQDFDGLRVIVLDGETGRPVEGAKVIVGDTTKPVGLTLSGAARFEPSTERFDIHIFSDDYEYQSLIGVKGKEFVVRLTKRPEATKQIGMNLDSVNPAAYRALGEEGDFILTLANRPLSLLPSELSPNAFFDSLRVVDAPFIGPFNPQSALPSNLHFASIDAEAAETISITTDTEVATTLWRFGALIDGDFWTRSATQRMIEGYAPTGALVLEGLRYAFEHSISYAKGALGGASVMLPDTGEFLDAPYDIADIDADGERSDRIPDYHAFPDVSAAFAASSALEERLPLTVANDEIFFDSGFDTLFFILFADLGKAKGVPLGMMQKHFTPEEEDLTHIFVSMPYALDETLNIARFAITLFAFDGKDFMKNGERNDFLSVTNYFDAIPVEHTFTRFGEQTKMATMEMETRTLTIAKSDGVKAFVVRFEGDEQAWSLFIDADGQKEESALEIRLPEVLESPISETFQVIAIKEEYAATGATPLLNELFSMNANSPSQFAERATRAGVTHWQ